MVDRVRATAKVQHDRSRGNKRMELYSKVRGVEIKVDGTEISDDDVNSALLALEENTRPSLTLLKIAFVQEQKHIVTFLRHKSALHFVVGRLISSDPFEQLEALECCCNAALGDPKSCSLLANAAAIYVIHIVHGTNLNLIVSLQKKVALTVLGNLSVGNVKNCRLLHEQGVCPALITALKVVEIRDLAAKALCQFTLTYLAQLPDSEVIDILDAALPYFDGPTEIRWLIGQLSAREIVRTRMSPSLAIDRLRQIDHITDDNIKSVTALIRLLGNVGAPLLDCVVLDGFRKLVSQCAYPHVRKEYDWAVLNSRNDTSLEMET